MFIVYRRLIARHFAAFRNDLWELESIFSAAEVLKFGLFSQHLDQGGHFHDLRTTLVYEAVVFTYCKNADVFALLAFPLTETDATQLLL